MLELDREPEADMEVREDPLPRSEVMPTRDSMEVRPEALFMLPPW